MHVLLLKLDHTCDFPGCKNVIVLDGNMKNHRDICLAKDAGYISYPGLPGHIKTGCTASLAYKSRYCQQHEARSCKIPTSKGEGIIFVQVMCMYHLMYITKSK